MEKSQPRLPTCRARDELSRCVADADDEFAAVSIPRRMLPATARYPSGIELAVLLGLHVARRGFWDAASRNAPLRVKRGNAVVAWEHATAGSRIAVWCRLGFF